MTGHCKPLKHWKEWCWSWNSNTLATWCEELIHWKRPRCWERLKVGEEGDHRGWDGCMASLTRWTWVWVSSRSWWWTGKPGVLQSMESKRVGHDWATELFEKLKLTTRWPKHWIKYKKNFKYWNMFQNIFKYLKENTFKEWKSKYQLNE